MLHYAASLKNTFVKY